MATTIETHAGDHIDRIFSRALAKAVASGEMVSFNFNGDRYDVRPSDNHPGLLERWQAKQEAEAKAYRDSPAGVADASSRAAEVLASQAKVDRLVGQLPALLSNDASDSRGLLVWLAALTEAADDVGVRFDTASVCDALDRAGFRADMHVGDPPDSFGDRRKAAEYVVGQAMTFMAQGMSPHPMTADVAMKVLRDGGQ